MQLISRNEARAAGARRYFTGRACRRGHIAERYASSKACTDCMISTGGSGVRQPRITFANLTESQKDLWHHMIDQTQRGMRFLYGSDRHRDETKPL